MDRSETEDFLADLQRLLPPQALLIPGQADQALLTPFLKDWRGRYHGKALAVALPTDTAQVAAVMRLCACHAVPLVPQGGNTSLVGGAIPDASGRQLVLSLRRMAQVLAVDEANLSMTAQAGCLLADVQQAAASRGLLFPLSLAAEGSCTIGGNLASNAGGTQVLRYGTARELCLGIEVVTAAGEVWNGLTALRKDNSGYDLRDVFIGSEGTLGIITGATLRLFNQPRGKACALAACGTVADAVALLRRARARLDAGLTGFELMHRRPLEMVRLHLPELSAPLRPFSIHEAPVLPPWMVLIDTASAVGETAAEDALQALLEDASAHGEILSAAPARSGPQRQAMWALREAIPSAERLEGLMVKHDIAVPTSAIPAFVQTCEERLEAAFPGCRIVCFGHMGDGNLHYNVQGSPTQDSAAFVSAHEAEVNEVVYDVALSLGGTLSAEHGIGQLRRRELSARKSPVALSLMHALKTAWDPANLLNPGRLL